MFVSWSITLLYFVWFWMTSFDITLEGPIFNSNIYCILNVRKYILTILQKIFISNSLLVCLPFFFLKGMID